MAMFRHPEDAARELALQDVFLLPGYWEGGSRREVDLTPTDFVGGSHGLVSANMNAVTGKRLSEVLARFGGLGILPQDIDLEALKGIIAYIKAAHPRYDTALTVGPGGRVRDVRDIIHKRAANLVVVVDRKNRPIGVISPEDIADKDAFLSAKKVMSDAPIVITEGMEDDVAFALLKERHVKAAPVVNADGVLIGVTSRHDIATRQIVRPSLDAQGRLMVGVAIGINGDPVARSQQVLDFGADVLVLDTAHGAQRKMVEAIRSVRAAVGPDVVIVAGNVCTGEATKLLIEAGASGVKVNVGPGAMCTTRMVTGVGRPTFSAVKECAEMARSLNAFAWADGGVKDPRDMALYLAAGASRVMAGTLFTGTFESPGDMEFTPEGEMYKVNWGMASARAVRDRNGDQSALEQAVRTLFKEGISSSQVFLRKGREAVGLIVSEFVTGALSSFTYVGAREPNEFFEKAMVGVQTHAGFHEGTPHGRVRR